VARLILIASALARVTWGAPQDLCKQKIPAALNDVLRVQFPRFRPARLTDQSGDDTRLNKRSGGDGCVSVGIGDFDGDGQKDIALLMTNGQPNSIRLVVALTRGRSWTISRLPTWCATISRCYVRTVKPGLYKRSLADASPISSPDERDQIESKTENVMSGTTEATGVVYVYIQGRWRYVWVSD
jgi:hypothetical protein